MFPPLYPLVLYEGVDISGYSMSATAFTVAFSRLILHAELWCALRSLIFKSSGSDFITAIDTRAASIFATTITPSFGNADSSQSQRYARSHY